MPESSLRCPECGKGELEQSGYYKWLVKCTHCHNQHQLKQWNRYLDLWSRVMRYKRFVDFVCPNCYHDNCVEQSVAKPKLLRCVDCNAHLILEVNNGTIWK